nr:hypothetical protein [Tanacetum cinerariifolium]
MILVISKNYSSNNGSSYTTTNGVSERKNRASKEMVNSMLSYSRLSEGPKDIISNSNGTQGGDLPGETPVEIPEPQRSNRAQFSMKDMGEADVILGIRIKRENKGLTITQSHYIEIILKKFNCEGCGPVSTPMEAGIKLIPHMGKPVNQLEYSWAIGCLMYAMTSTRPDIAYAVRKLSRFTSNPSYSDASWITNSEDHTSTTALAATGKEARWLRNLIYEIPLWPKPISPLSMHCDSAATLAKAYSQIYNEKYRYLGLKQLDVLEGVTLGHYERLPVGLRQVGGGGKGVVVMAEACFGHRSFAQEMWRRSGEVGFQCFDREVEKGYVRRDLRPKDRSFREMIEIFCASS